MTIARCFYTLIASLLTGSQSAATNYRTEDRYNPQHIDSLPREIRSSILHRSKRFDAVFSLPCATCPSPK